MRTMTTAGTALAVVDARGQVLVIMAGRDAEAAARELAEDGYRVVAVEAEEWQRSA